MVSGSKVGGEGQTKRVERWRSEGHIRRENLRKKSGTDRRGSVRPF